MAVQIATPWRKRLDKQGLPNVRTKLSKIERADLFNYLDPLIYQLSQDIGQWRRGFGPVALQEAYAKTLTILEVIRELESRQT